MRWSYKTVNYELKKEGLLGSTFLDESEVEISLNEYGKAGWELVSILETMDGLIAVFKQPLSLDNVVYPPSPKEVEPQDTWGDNDDASESIELRHHAKQDIKVIRQEGNTTLGSGVDSEIELDELPDEEPATDVGSIRIE